jgi:hypothetical protein
LIRRANVDDITALLLELRQFAKSYGTRLALFPSDEEKAFAVVRRLIEKHLFLVADEGGIITGFICGFVAEHHFNPDIIILSECLWWVTPGRRLSRVAHELFKEYVDWGRKHCDWITMTVEAKSPVKAWTLEKRGFRLMETSYLLETHPGGA